MANLKISQLAQLTDPTGSDVIPIVNYLNTTQQFSLSLFNDSISNQRLTPSSNKIDMAAYNIAYTTGTTNKSRVRQVVHISSTLNPNSGGNIMSIDDYVSYADPNPTYGATIDYVLLEDGTYFTLEVGTINVGIFPHAGAPGFDYSFSHTFSYQSQNINSDKTPEIISPGTFNIHPVDNPGYPMYITLGITKQPGDYDFQSVIFKGLITFL